MDRNLRVAVKNWLRLPSDTADAFLYAKAEDGGLEVPCLSVRIPLMRKARIEKLSRSTDPAVLAAAQGRNVLSDLRYWCRPVLAGDVVVGSNEEANKAFATALWRTVDGCGLRPATEYPKCNRWPVVSADWISGSDYIKAIQVRASTLSTPLRSSRGRPGVPSTCTMCGVSASLGHMSQACPRTHGLRIKRHDDVLGKVCSELGKKGWRTLREPPIPYDGSYLKPDLIIWKEGTEAQILDVQVVADAFSMGPAHSRKVEKYGSAGFKARVRELVGVPVGRVSSVTLNWRGQWHKASARDLERLGLSLGHLMVMSVKVLSWTHNMWKCWSRSGVAARRFNP